MKDSARNTKVNVGRFKEVLRYVTIFLMFVKLGICMAQLYSLPKEWMSIDKKRKHRKRVTFGVS